MRKYFIRSYHPDLRVRYCFKHYLLFPVVNTSREYFHIIDQGIEIAKFSMHEIQFIYFFMIASRM